MQTCHSIHFLSNRHLPVGKGGLQSDYIYGFTGTLQKKLTTGQYDVTTLLAEDEQTQTLFYEAADEPPAQECLQDKFDKGQPQKLSVRQGYNQHRSATTGNFLSTVSDTRTPPLITLHDATGKELRVLEITDNWRHSWRRPQLPQKGLSRFRQLTVSRS
jgi:dipeptidyl-peptidase-4